MKQEISALMDGELFDDEAERCIKSFKGSEDTQKNWAMYHLIGDSLRQPHCLTPDLSATMRLRLQSEPVVLAPRTRTIQQKVHYFGLSAAATLAAVGVVAWMSLNLNPQASLQQKMAQQTAVQPASMQIKASASEYLIAHQEFSPSTDMNGGAAYIRAIAYNAGGK